MQSLENNDLVKSCHEKMRKSLLLQYILYKDFNQHTVFGCYLRTCINKSYVGAFEMMFGLTGGNSIKVITQIIWANNNNESFVYRSLPVHAMFDQNAFSHLSEHRTSFQAFCPYVCCAYLPDRCGSRRH